MIAAIATEPDLAEVLFLVSFIIFLIVTILHIVRNAVESAITTAGLACVALAWLLL